MRATTTPPQNLDAEELVIGALMLSEGAFDKIAETGLRSDEFYRPSHAAIFTAAFAMNERGEPVDAVTLAAELQRTKMLDKAGGTERIFELSALVPSAGNAGHYARLVRETAACRALVEAGQNITRLGYEAPGDTNTLLALAESELTKAVSPSSTVRAATSITDGADEWLAEIRQAYQTGEAIMGASTGYPSLDDKLGGFWPGQLVLTAARPGMGKSTLALNIAENFAMRAESVLFASLEMSRHELAIRSLAREAKIDSRLLASGQMSEEQAARLGAAVPRWKARPKVMVQDDGSMTVPTLRAEARKLKRQGDLGLVVVDYLQLMQGTGEENRNQEIGTISRSLKLLARELDVPVLALSQMSRNIEHRAEKRPVLADLRDSGSLEQDADVVLFIHSDAEYQPDVEPDGTVEVIVAKNRKGQTGTVKLAYNRKYSSFGEMGGSNA